MKNFLPLFFIQTTILVHKNFYFNPPKHNNFNKLTKSFITSSLFNDLKRYIECKLTYKKGGEIH